MAYVKLQLIEEGKHPAEHFCGVFELLGKLVQCAFSFCSLKNFGISVSIQSHELLQAPKLAVDFAYRILSPKALKGGFVIDLL